ncbi:starch-binding protein [Segatella copri]
MYGEVCARFGSVQYRGQDNLSPYYYTWKAPKDLMDGFDGSQSYWDTQEIYDSGTGYDAKLMPLCEKDNADSPESNNTFMLNGAWHEPDYSQSSGFNVIDFPLHYNFSSAGSAYGLAKSGDMKYNDATFNVVYVDSHDYGPQPSDGIRFSGSDAQWAENLSLMFTFRGIPCLYYGSEVGFRRGSVIDKGPNGPLSNTGRAYFGGYITGDVEASDFGEYKASGNVEATLNHDLAQHLIRLNKIRQAVPALRKGQWTDEGCAANGGIAFKRAYKDSYALVALNGGATFTDCPAGTYTDLVTGKTYTGPTITVDAPSNQGQVRVLVKDWKGGKLIDDGAFIYASTAQHKSGQDYDGNEEAGTTWVDETPLQPVSVSLSPAGGSFRTNTVTVTAELSEDALSGWYQIEGQDKVALTPGKPATFTIGDDMNFNQTKTVTWSATSSEGEKTGKVTYTKVDPNAAITVYVKADKAPYIHAWITGGKNLTGEWPGKVMDGPVEIDGAKYWTYDFDNVESFNVILNNGSGAQSGEISGITGDTYLEYDGSRSAKKIDAPVNTVATAKVTLSPNGGDFQKTISVTATLSNNAKSGWYKIGDGEQVALTPGKATTFTLGDDMLEGESKTVTWSATNADNETKTGSATFNKQKEVVIPTPTGIFAYFLAPSDWTDVHAYVWTDGDKYAGEWPGVACTKTGEKKNGLDIWMWKYDGDKTELPAKIIFNNNGNGNNQTGNFDFVNGAVYDRNGKTNESVSTGINQVGSKKAPAKLKIYSINGVKVAEVNKVSDAEYVLAPGMYICNGKKFVIK